MPPRYSFLDELIVRVPRYPFPDRFDEASFERCISDPCFQEALYLATPLLYDEGRKWQEGKRNAPGRPDKLLHSLVKYYSRISSRSTPFGLFAGCSVVRWGEARPFALDEDGYRRHTRLSMQYLCALTRALGDIPEVRRQLRYSPNTSLHRIKDELRLTENYYWLPNATPQMSSVYATEYVLNALQLSESGVTPDDIAAGLGRGELSQEEALSFVEDLIDARVLVSELEPSVTGTDYLGRVLTLLEKIGPGSPDSLVGAVFQVLSQVQAGLAALDASPANNAQPYEHIGRALASLGVPFERNKLFCVDLSARVTDGALDQRLQTDIAEALEVLHYLTPEWKNQHLENFKADFLLRYEGREVPLLDVLDSEIGIGYANKGKTGSTSLTEDLVLPRDPDAPVINWGEAQQFLFNKLRDVSRTGGYHLDLSQAHLPNFSRGGLQLPPSVSVMFRLASPELVVLESVGGSSAANLLGRFASDNPGIQAVAGRITQAERDANPEVVFAEIVHLPESRAGNILLRPVLRDYEIPYLAQPGLPPAQQLPLGDLLVSVQNNTLLLRSKKLGKRVVPRLSTAHNYALQSMPTYQFLCDLQCQGLQGHLGFNWDEMFPGAKFLPRLNYGKVVLHLATWRLQQEDFGHLTGDAGEPFAARFEAFRHQWQLPRFFTLADGDNELLVDAENPLTVRAWIGTIRTRDSICLKEFLFDPDRCAVKDSQDRPYVPQFIASLMRQDACYAAEKAVAPPGQHPVLRDFWPGSEWLYYKLYCGINTADQVLREAIKPAADELLAGHLINKWFFVRYGDPDTHLRVRFHLNPNVLLGDVLPVVNRYLQPYQRNGYVWKNQIDTYSRELERYGHQSMEGTETLFYHDSVAVADVLEQLNGEELEGARWLCAIKSIDELLNAFSYPLAAKLQLMHRTRDHFAREFRLDKELKLQLDARYRTEKSAIQQVLRPAQGAPAHYATLFAPFYHRTQQLSEVARQIMPLYAHDQPGLDNLLTSYVHMSVNRLIASDQRLHEVVLYDFLGRQYQSESKMQRQPQGSLR